MTESSKFKGYLAGIIAAVAYGTNPLGALFLYQEGFNPPSVIFYRFTFAVIILAIILLVQKVPFRINKFECKVLLSLGVLFAASALSLYTSFKHLDSGVASTILFAYPVMVAVIMAVFFKERASMMMILSIVLSIIGILLLYQGDGEAKMSLWGVILVLISSLTYAVYIVVVNRTQISMPPFKMTFYIMAFAAIIIGVYSFCVPGSRIMAIPSWTALGWICMVAIVPTIIAMTMLNIGILHAGSTPTAILGALEPVTAVCISVLVFDGLFTARLVCGIVLILAAVLLIIKN
ncbi:MAG: DMT family transporter [Bacteroidales bacterium]|nr:DMT family transporter [Bacteroidales bacterium]